MATNYAGLQVISVFDGSNYAVCRWKLPSNQQTELLFNIFGEGFDCEYREPRADLQLKCVESNGIINSTLVILYSLQTNIVVSIECSEIEFTGPVIQILTTDTINVAGECKLRQLRKRKV